MARRLYCSGIQTGQVVIEGPEAHHGRDVLRLRVSDLIDIFDGEGRFAHAKVMKIGKSTLELQVDQIQQETVIRPWITLATAVPKYAHQETLVRMGTEVGVSEFQPVICERSSVREQFRSDKWRRWTIEACKQCGGQFLPAVQEAVELKSLLSTIGEYGLIVFGDMQGEERNWQGVVLDTKRILILVGPEGGFTQEEIEQIRSAGGRGMRVGPNILRIETAGISLTAVVRFLSTMKTG